MCIYFIRTNNIISVHDLITRYVSCIKKNPGEYHIHIFSISVFMQNTIQNIIGVIIISIHNVYLK